MNKDQMRSKMQVEADVYVESLERTTMTAEQISLVRVSLQDFLASRQMELFESLFPSPETCKDDWHLGWQGLIKKYGQEEAEKRYRFYRSCPSGCGARVDPGD